MKTAMKFLKTYKGKKADMKITKKLVGMDDAESMVKEAHNTYKTKNTVVVNAPKVIKKVTTAGTRVIKG
jgi:hypothetical protein